MPLIKETSLASDPWYHASDDTPLLPDVPATISLARWRAERENIIRSGMDIGLRLASHEAAEDIAPDLTHFGIIILNFPAFTDGRAYSQARLIRDRFNFTGEIRATGDVLYDQLKMMQRCGFNAFDIKKKTDVDGFINALKEIDLFYQGATGAETSLRQARKITPTSAVAAE